MYDLRHSGDEWDAELEVRWDLRELWVDNVSAFIDMESYPPAIILQATSDGPRIHNKLPFRFSTRWTNHANLQRNMIQRDPDIKSLIYIPTKAALLLAPGLEGWKLRIHEA